MDSRGPIGGGFPFSGSDGCRGDPGRNRDKIPGRAIRQEPTEHEKSAVGNDDIALTKNSVRDRRFRGQMIGLGLGRRLPFNPTVFLGRRPEGRQQEADHEQAPWKLHNGSSLFA
jgi:hypothetical protein